MKRRTHLSAHFASLLILMTNANAQDARGVWERDTGTARVQIGACGDKLCGTVVWVRDKNSATKVGMRVFYDMEPERAGNWTGKAFNPEDKQTYQGVLTLTSPTTMKTSGCMIGKLLCRSMYWRRAGG